VTCGNSSGPVIKPVQLSPAISSCLAPFARESRESFAVLPRPALSIDTADRGVGPTAEHRRYHASR
jgi:hypothetical protein